LAILHSHAGANYDAKGEKVYGAPRDLDKKDAYDELHALTTSDGMTMKDGITRLGLPDFHRVSSRTIRTVAEVLEVLRETKLWPEVRDHMITTLHVLQPRRELPTRWVGVINTSLHAGRNVTKVGAGGGVAFVAVWLCPWLWLGLWLWLWL